MKQKGTLDAFLWYTRCIELINMFQYIVCQIITVNIGNITLYKVIQTLPSVTYVSLICLAKSKLVDLGLQSRLFYLRNVSIMRTIKTITKLLIMISDKYVPYIERTVLKMWFFFSQNISIVVECLSKLKHGGISSLSWCNTCVTGMSRKAST